MGWWRIFFPAINLSLKKNIFSFYLPVKIGCALVVHFNWTVFLSIVIFSDNELAFSTLLLPGLMNEKLPIMYAEENDDISVVKPVIVYRSSSNIFFDFFLDKINITIFEDLVIAITLWFTLFWAFDVGYTKEHIKALSFLKTLLSSKSVLWKLFHEV